MLFQCALLTSLFSCRFIKSQRSSLWKVNTQQICCSIYSCMYFTLTWKFQDSSLIKYVGVDSIMKKMSMKCPQKHLYKKLFHFCCDCNNDTRQLDVFNSSVLHAINTPISSTSRIPCGQFQLFGNSRLAWATQTWGMGANNRIANYLQEL